MRWKAEPVPEDGSIRIISKFLFLPKSLNGEWRWLERAFICQRWDIGYGAMFGQGNDIWMDVGWADGETMESLGQITQGTSVPGGGRPKE